jgi:chemotaxis protein methyltransferase CheR
MLRSPRRSDVLLRDLVHEHTGIFFEDGKAHVLIEKLTPLILERGFASALDYYYLLKYDDAAGEEWPRVMDALSVQETYFWREIDQVRAFVDVLVPEWVRDNPGAPLPIWSAACATGEEPLTIAMLLNEAGWFERIAIDLVASDGSPAAVEKARRGLYRERSLRSIPADFRGKYFTKEGALWRVSPGLHRAVRWATANLADEADVARLASVPFLFCRNVFIYFSPDTVRKTARLFCRHMRPPAYLFLSASESLFKLTNEFDLREIEGAFVYQRSPGRTSI